MNAHFIYLSALDFLIKKFNFPYFIFDFYFIFKFNKLNSITRQIAKNGTSKPYWIEWKYTSVLNFVFLYYKLGNNSEDSLQLLFVIIRIK